MYESCGLKTTEHISHYGKYKLHTRSFMPFPAQSRVGPPRGEPCSADIAKNTNISIPVFKTKC